ncbi:MAG TPA: DUF695 domain-containing protein [Sphingomicrobium sp.]
MTDKLSISGDGDDWNVFSKTAQSGTMLLFRSRTRSPAVQAFANANQMMRLRCVLREDQVGEGGMPKSTKDLDEYEDRLLGKLQEANAEVYLIAVVTGEGNRDLFFTARDLDDLRAGIKAAQTDIDTFKLQIAPIGDPPAFLKMLTLSVEQEQAAIAGGRVHEVPAGRSGGLLGKLFGR